jgi:Tol biopolymer transport system component
VSSSGGDASPLPGQGSGSQENAPRWPSFLPDGRHFLYVVGSSRAAGLYVGDIDSTGTTRVGEFNSRTVFAAPGYVVFSSLTDRALMAQRFDPAAFRVLGAPVQLAEAVASFGNQFNVAVSASETGMLSYVERDESTTQLVWTDRAGQTLGTVEGSVGMEDQKLSPDGTRVAAQGPGIETREVGNIWLIEAHTGVMSRVPAAPSAAFPLWSPDGASLVYRSGNAVYRKALRGCQKITD